MEGLRQPCPPRQYWAKFASLPVLGRASTFNVWLLVGLATNPRHALRASGASHSLEPQMASYLARHRLHAFSKQCGLCFYCEFPMWSGSPDELRGKYRLANASIADLQCTAEHLIPKSDGGANSRQNIVAAHLFCNQERHRTANVLSPEEYRREVQAKVARGQWLPFFLSRDSRSGAFRELQDIPAIPAPPFRGGELREPPPCTQAGCL